MKTIEIKSGEQTAQFTTKSVSFDGKEFFYSRMEDLRHDPEHHIYYFTYAGESKILPYEAKYEKVLSAIFTQVENLQARKATNASNKIISTKRSNDPNISPQPPETHQSGAPVIKDVMKEEDNTAQKESVTDNNGLKPESETVQAAENNEPVVFTDKKAAKQAEKERKKAEKQKRKEEKQKIKAEKTGAHKQDNPENSGNECDNQNNPDRKRKMKKALITFAIIIAVMAVIAVVCYFIFGTSNNPSSIAPNSDESQQYEDIDQLIDDLQ